VPVRRWTAALCAVLLLAGCAKQGVSGGGGPSGVLRVANYVEPTTLNPLLISNTGENFIASLAFDMLVTLDDKGNDVPDLASQVPTLSNHGISKDGLTITYKLRHGVKWQDGAPFTSADVKFSWQAVMNPANNVVERRGYDQVASVDTPDPYTVVFHLKRRFAPFVDTVFGESDDPFRIVPKHLLGKLANINKAAFNALPIGTGPFRIVRWVHGDHVELDANPDYFRGKPKLKKILVYYVADDNTRAAEIRSHQIDLILALSAANYQLLKNNPAVKVLLVKAPNYSAILFNFKHPPLDDVRVRQAIAYAINSAAMVKSIEHDTAVAGTEDLSDFYWAYDPNVTRYPFDPQKAAQLLDAAGWHTGAGGIRYKDGQPLQLQFVYGQGSETARQIGVATQAALRAIGVEAAIKTYTYETLYATKAAGGILDNGKFDLAEEAWVSGADPDDSSHWMCSMAPPAGNNVSQYCNAKFDAAERAALATSDRTIRKKAYATTQSLMASDAAGVFMFYPRLRYAMNPNLQNFKPNGPSEGWNAYEWNL
jgi:peptide/nickel transport system substrate-binding protein